MLRDLAPGTGSLDRVDVARFEHYTCLLEKSADDAAVMNGLFTELGPQGVVAVPIALKDFAESYSRDLGYQSDENLMWDDDTPMTARTSELQQRLMESFGAGWATSTNSAASPRANSAVASHPAAGAPASAACPCRPW